MLKLKEPVNQRFKRNIKQFGANVLNTDQKDLMCIPCNQAIPTKEKSQVVQHINSAKHASNVLNREAHVAMHDDEQEFLPDLMAPKGTSQNEYNKEL